MAKLSALLMSRPANAPDGGFVVQLILGVARDGVHFYPTRDDVDAPGIAHAFRDLAMWLDVHPDEAMRWYDGRTFPECERVMEETCSCSHPVRRHDDTGCKDCGCPVGATDVRQDGVDETAVRRSRREKHPHMHGRECDVCAVIAAMAHASPWEERGLPGSAPRRVCQWCGVFWRDGDENPSHPSSCVWLRARGLADVYGLETVHR